MQWSWGDAYDIGADDDAGWWFQRRDSIGGKQTTPGPEELRRAIVDDYTFRPVRRDIAPDVEKRRDAYETAGVRIWRDPGRWHARWPVGDTHAGTSHPGSLDRLLDRLDALKHAGRTS